VTAIFVDTDVPEQWAEYIEQNRREAIAKTGG
jgi:hypothetical protein